MEISSLLGSSRSRVRAKATAAALRLFTLYPDSVLVGFKRLVENLEGGDGRVSSASVGVFCELSVVDPKAYIPLAPEFYRILVDSRNNWILIKVLKIFQRLAPLEPRLARKILDPVCDHLRQSSAKSLVFECIRTVFTCLDGFDSAVKLGVEKLGEFLQTEDDPNLRYLSLKALSMLQPIHLWAVEERREIVVKSLGDPDSNIRREALHLIMKMVADANLIEISTILLHYASRSDPEFADEILGEILSLSCRNYYELVTDFDWFVALLGDIARHPHFSKGEDIERHLVDIGFRVKDARPELVRVARDLLIDPSLLGNPLLSRVLSAAAWISGEYVEFSGNPVELVEALLQPRVVLLPVSIRAIYIQSLFKILIFCFNNSCEQSAAGERDSESVFFEISSGVMIPEDYSSKGEFWSSHCAKRLQTLIEESLDPLLECREVELQERARNVLGFIRAFHRVQDSNSTKIVSFMGSAFAEDLGPVSENAPTLVSVPDGITLREDLSDMDAILETSSLTTISFMVNETGVVASTLSTESISMFAEHRRQNDVYYLPNDEYPPVKVIQPSDGGVEEGSPSMDGLIRKLGRKESTGQRKMKPRPVVVVKLDERQRTSPVASSSPVRDDPLSGVIREVLHGKDNDDKATTTSRKKSSRKDEISADSRRGERHRRREKNGNGGEERKTHDESRKSSHHHPHSRSPPRAPSAPVPDLLLL